MGAAFYRARAELRRRWKATLALVLIAGLSGGMVLTMVAGARRSSTGYDRFRQETRTGDIDITPSDQDPARIAEVRQLPEVEVLAPVAYPFITPQGSDLYPYLDFVVEVGPDGTLTRDVDRPRIIHGRMPDPDRAGEFAIIERFASEQDLEVGDRVTFESFSPRQFDVLFGGGEAGPPSGPVVTLTVTGVVRAPKSLSESLASFEPQAILSPAFYREYHEQIGAYEGVFRVLLGNGERDLPSFIEGVRRIYRADPDLQLVAASSYGDRIDDTVQVLVVALLLCAAGAGLAGMAAIGQAFARNFFHTGYDQPTLTGMGMGRRQRTVALAATAIPVAVGGAVVAVVVAVVASPLMPLGVARQAEPDPGLSIDGAVLGLGFGTVVVIVALLALLAAWPASAAATLAHRPEPSGRARPSVLPQLLAALHLSLPATTGVRMALEPGHGRTAVPVRSVLAGIVAAVVGLVAVLLFAASLTALTASPGRYGFPWDAIVSQFGGRVVDEVGDDLADDPTVRDLGTVSYSVARSGDDQIVIHAFEARKGSVSPTLIDGRLALRADEVVLGTATLRDLGADIGETIELTGPRGQVPLRVVGRAAFPILDDRSGVARGAALTPQGLEPLARPDTFFRDLLIGWGPEVDEAAANRRLEARTGAQVFSPRLPSDVNNLDQVAGLPRASAVFLAGLAFLALTHALVTTVRRRRQDLAVLRTVGFVGRQVSATVAWQATTFAVGGLAVGVPLGVVAGRAAWGVVANGIGVADNPATPVFVLAAVGLAVVLVANLVAALPALMARRVRPAAVFRRS